MEVAICGARDPPNSVEDRYQYEPLVAEDAVRVLNLEPADDFQSPLCGFITQHQPAIELLDPDGCRYSAVSYTWGDPTPSQKLSLRLNTKWTFLPITRNADLLLRYLRVSHKNKPLWIDGICLNQKDEGEKAQQIRVMGQIYAYAKKVHIWLGDDEMEDAQQAFSLMRRIEFDESRTLDPGTDQFLCLERLFNRPWFTRRWVIQELFFSHNAVFHCGFHTLSLSRVMAVLAEATIQGWSNLPGLGLKMLRSTIGVGQMQSPRKGLDSLLWDLHESECTDMRDRIAALYSLSNILERPPLHYDVGDWKNLYEDVASYYINNGTKSAYTLLLHLWSFGPFHLSTADDVPTWVPNWSTRRQKQIDEPMVPKTVMRDPNRARWTTWWWFRYDGSRYRLSWLFSPGLRHDNRQWEQKYDHLKIDGRVELHHFQHCLKLHISERKLRLEYSFLTFIYECGIVDEVVYPSRSEDFWEEIVGLATWRKKRSNRARLYGDDRDVIERWKGHKIRHQKEVRSLSSLLVSVLADRDPTSPHAFYDLIKSVERLCEGVSFSRGRMSNSRALTDDQKGILRRFRYSVNNLAIVRIQATLGYYWALGPTNVAKGDWMIPITAQGEIVAPWPAPQITPLLFLRPVSPERRENLWYPSLLSDPESRLHRLLALRMPEVDSVHITGRFVGSGGGCLHAFMHYLDRDKVLWRILLRASEAAKRKGLPGPTIFDIL